MPLAGTRHQKGKVPTLVATLAPIGRTEIAPTAEEVLAICEERGVRFVNLQFSDVMGHVKTVTIPFRVFPHVIEDGQWFDGSSIAGFARIAESDMFLMPDLATFHVLPWESGDRCTAQVICWVHKPDGELFSGDPRAVLYRQLERAAKLGFRFNTGPEPEFFLFTRDSEGKLSVLPHDQGVAREIGDVLEVPLRILAQNPSHVGPPEAALDVIGVELPIDVAVVLAVVSAPLEGRVLDRGGSEQEVEGLDQPVRLVRGVAEEAVVPARDRHATAREVAKCQAHGPPREVAPNRPGDSSDCQNVDRGNERSVEPVQFPCARLQFNSVFKRKPGRKSHHGIPDRLLGGT